MKSKWSYLEFQNINKTLFVPNSHVCVKRHPSQALELELKVTKEKYNSHSVPVSFSHCHAVISRGLGVYLVEKAWGGGNKQLDESASQSLIIKYCFSVYRVSEKANAG